MKVLLDLAKDEVKTLMEAAKRAGLEAVSDSLEGCLDEDDPETDEKYREACHKSCSDGDLECDEGAVVSKGGDAGAYVMCWKWVSDEEAGIKEEECESPKS